MVKFSIPDGQHFQVIRTLIFAVCIQQILPSIQGTVFMCYWGSWSHHRQGEGRFSIEDIDPNLCTHVIYSFASISNQTFRMVPADPDLDHGPNDSPPGTQDMYRQFIALKEKNQLLKVLLGVGGAKLGSKVFSDMAATRPNRKLFIDSVISTFKTFGFDGLDVDWEFPTVGYGARPVDKDNFVLLLKELRTALDPLQPPRLLTAAIGAGIPTIIDAYDIPEIEKSLNFLNVMAYDYKLYQPESPNISHHSPLSSYDTNDELTIEASITHLLNLGIDPQKLILGVGAYGRTYTLETSDKNGFGDEAADRGVAYKYTNEPGIVAFFEMCLYLVGVPGWEFEFDDGYNVPFAFNETQWIGYDDFFSAISKVDLAKDRGLGGMMIWSLDMDDCKNYCGGWGNGCYISHVIKSRMDYRAHEIINPTTDVTLTSNGDVTSTSNGDVTSTSNGDVTSTSNGDVTSK